MWDKVIHTSREFDLVNPFPTVDVKHPFIKLEILFSLHVPGTLNPYTHPTFSDHPLRGFEERNTRYERKFFVIVSSLIVQL